MKYSFFAFAFFLLLLTGCEEIPPTINTTSTDPVVENPKVLVAEKFTAVRCPNCPQATDLLKDFTTNHPGRIITVSIYNDLTNQGSIVEPGDPDLNFPDAALLRDLLGTIVGLPTAAFNRTDYESGLLSINRLKWPAYKDEELAKSADAKLQISDTFDASNRLLTVEVEVEVVADINDAAFITVYLTEDGVVAGQELPDGSIDEEYDHEHILRAAITSLTGDAVTESTSNGSKFTKTITYTIPAGWDAANMNIVAILHKNTGANREVIQSAEDHIGN